MNNETFTDQDLIAELQAHHPPVKQREPGFGVTAQEWAKAQGIHQRQGWEQLDKMLDDGTLDRERMRCEDGRIRWVYFKP